MVEPAIQARLMSRRLNWERGFRRITWVVSIALAILAVSVQLDLSPTRRTPLTPLLELLDDFALLLTAAVYRVWPTVPSGIVYGTLVVSVGALPWAVFFLLRWIARGFSAERPV